MTQAHRRVTPVALAAVLIVGAPALTACGSLAENALEQAAGDAIGGDIDLNDGGLTITSSDGTQVQVGENLSIPDNWPDTVPTLDGGTLVSVMASGDGATLNAIWSTQDAPDAAASAYGAALEAAGFATIGTTEFSDVLGTAGGDYTGNGYTVNIVAVAGDDGVTTLIMSAQQP